MRPIHEPAKPSKEMRYLLTKEGKDQRFAKLVDAIRRIATEFVIPANTLRGATAVVVHELRYADYSNRQAHEFKAEQAAKEDDNPEEVA
jgi:G:T-mismatch repair DNA endonuclease (very short patch repair protein)